MGRHFEYRRGSLEANRNNDELALALFQQAAERFEQLRHQHGHAMATVYAGLMLRRFGQSTDAMNSRLTALHDPTEIDDDGA